MTFIPMLVCGADTVFLKALGGSNYEESWGLIKTQDGGYVMTGYTMSLCHTRPPLGNSLILTKTVYRGRDFHKY
jgi:hypothetical protein